MSQYFPPYRSHEEIKVEIDLRNYATKKDLKMWHMWMEVVLHQKQI